MHGAVIGRPAGISASLGNWKLTDSILDGQQQLFEQELGLDVAVYVNVSVFPVDPVECASLSAEVIFIDLTPVADFKSILQGHAHPYKESLVCYLWAGGASERCDQCEESHVRRHANHRWHVFNERIGIDIMIIPELKDSYCAL
eukprot:4899478-Heterocapsa_arctica.AAC.1